MSYFHQAGAAGFSMLTGYIRDYAAPLIPSFLRKEKVVRKLDPIGTLCMLTLRNFEPYDKAKPSMNGHFFWTTHRVRLAEATTRARENVEHDDFAYLEEPLQELITYWRLPQTSTLVKIAQEAIKALEKTPTAYEGKTNCVKTTAAYYKTLLEGWIKSLATSTPAPQDTDFIKKIRDIWPDTNINLYHDLYSRRVLESAEGFLTSQRADYLRAIQPDTKTGLL